MIAYQILSDEKTEGYNPKTIERVLYYLSCVGEEQSAEGMVNASIYADKVN